MTGKAVVYAGTFDPITMGHIDVIKRALKMFDSVIVAITTNPRKKPLFSLGERVALAKSSLEGFQGVRVESFSGLLVDYLRKKKITVILRGLRELSDFEYEFQYGLVNRKLYPLAETIFFIPSEPFIYLNSTVAKTLAKNGASVSCLVPECVEKALKRKFSRR